MVHNCFCLDRTGQITPLKSCVVFLINCTKNWHVPQRYIFGTEFFKVDLEGEAGKRSKEMGFNNDLVPILMIVVLQLSYLDMEVYTLNPNLDFLTWQRPLNPVADKFTLN